MGGVLPAPHLHHPTSSNMQFLFAILALFIAAVAADDSHTVTFDTTDGAFEVELNARLAPIT